MSIVGLYGRIRWGPRGGNLPCGGCQRFESAYLQLVNLNDIENYMIALIALHFSDSVVWFKL